MGIIEQELDDYVWEHISLLESVFSEKIYKILQRFREKEHRESFSDTLEAVVDVDSEVLKKLEIRYENNEVEITKEVALDEVYIEIGNVHFDRKKYDKALKNYQKAIDINPHNSKTYNRIGLVYYHKNEYVKAIENYQRAIDINPQDSQFYNNMGVVYSEKKEYDNAIKYYQKALQPPVDREAFNNLNNLMKSLNKAFFLDKKISNLNFFIDKIALENFKQYKNFSISFSEKINIIIGQNAIGKTTLLQAITLGLLKEDSLDTKQVDYNSCISKGKERAKLIVFHNDKEKKVEILKDKREIEENYFSPFVLAYGSNFFTSNTNEVKEIAQGIVNESIYKDFTSSIFVDYTSGFVNPIRLLEFLDLEKEDNVPIIQKTFIETINSFLEGFELVANDKNYYFTKNKEEEIPLRLEDLSEGYRGNVLLITDMLIKILGIGYTPETIEGIVMIDEFDKHLHPKWQSRLVNQLTKTFPKIQFIMTTHNPMSLLGRKANEITILKEIDGDIVAQTKEGTQNIDVSIILLKYFNVKSTVSETMQMSINDFNRLKLKKELTQEEQKELKEAEDFLGNTIASNLIYNRPYLKFLEFMRDNKEINFERYEKMNEEEMDALLKDFGEFLND